MPDLTIEAMSAAARDDFERDFYAEEDEQAWERHWRAIYAFEVEDMEAA